MIFRLFERKWYDNTNVNTDANNGIGVQWSEKYSPYVKPNGCFAHLFNLATEHSFEESSHLRDFDSLVKKKFKRFSKRIKLLLDLQGWHRIKKKKFHKYLTIFDIRFLSRMDPVSNYRKNLPAALDVLLKNSSDVANGHEARAKFREVYSEAIKCENIFLSYVLSDILTLGSKVSKYF